ncbi:MAG: hypothetical protein J6A75_12525 [Lachnospiraceae bacterium]|nr:hypothetical protein [Lachnospiraceae bacterium]
MRSRYFRYLFENLDDGMFHSGCIYDKAKETTTNFIYMTGNYDRNMKIKKTKLVEADKETIPQRVDILVVGGYTISYIKRLIYIVKNHEVEKVILPYLTPIQRLVMTEYVAEGDESAREIVRFLQDPYVFLKDIGLEDILFLYGNNTSIYREPEELESGSHFVPADAEILHMIREMEGYSLPVVKAGYIIENKWFFMFGVYGLDIHTLSEFTREYFGHKDKKEDYVHQMKRLIQKYMQTFGVASATTVAMYEGPIYASPRDNESFMVEKEFSRKERCEAWIHQKQDNCCTCAIRCLHDKDHDIMQHHKDVRWDNPRFGTLLLGNVNLKKYFSEVMDQFWIVRNHIRAVTVPNCGSKDDWNSEILKLSSEQERIYWICNRHEKTAPTVVNEIVMFSSNNRFLRMDKEMGGCFSGYIVPKEETNA